MTGGCKRRWYGLALAASGSLFATMIVLADGPNRSTATSESIPAESTLPAVSLAKTGMSNGADESILPYPPGMMEEFIARGDQDLPAPHGTCAIMVYQHNALPSPGFASVVNVGDSLWDDIEISSLTNRNICQITTQLAYNGTTVPYTVTLEIYNDFPTVTAGACDLSTVTLLGSGTAVVNAAGVQIVNVPITMITPIPDTRLDDPVPPGCAAALDFGAQLPNDDFWIRYSFSVPGPGPSLNLATSDPTIGCNDGVHGRCRATNSGLFSGFTGPIPGRFITTIFASGIAPTTGRCCDPVGDCTETTPAACVAPSVFNGLGSTCVGTPCRGRCCAPDGTCALTIASACVAPNTFAGLGTTCDGTPCMGKCCQPDGFCQVVGPAACTGAGFVFSGLGSACNPQTPDECLGRCCLADGGCIADGPAPCVANGGTFGGVGVQCNDGSLCRGRCCVGTSTCIPDSSPNSCAQAGGTLTLGLSCIGTTDFDFVTTLAIPDGPAGGGVGTPVTNVQNVSGLTGNISDVDVDIKITHTWVGDIVVDITHGGTTVTLIDLMGQATAAGGGCNSNNLNVILDDEGLGGAIETLCGADTNALVPTSPPNYTPNNPLSAFDGMDPNGPWTITCRDTFAADIGTLTGWSLHFANGLSPCAPSCTCKGDLNGSGTVNGADINKFAQCVASGGGAGCACADINGGGINSSDVTPFVNALIAGTACIP